MGISNRFATENYVGEKIKEIYVPDTAKLPAYTAEDESKFLRIVNGVPTWVTIYNAEELSF